MWPGVGKPNLPPFRPPHTSVRGGESSRSCSRISGDDEDEDEDDDDFVVGDGGGGDEYYDGDDVDVVARGAGRAVLSVEQDSLRRPGLEEQTELVSAAGRAYKTSMDPHCGRDSRCLADISEDSPGTQGLGADCCRTR